MSSKAALYISLSVSILIHGVALITTDSNNTININSSSNQIPTISARIIPPPATAQEKEHQQQSRKETKYKTKPEATTQKNISGLPKEYENKNTATSLNEEKEPSRQLNSTYRENVVAQIQKDLQKFFYYPRIAQRKNWQGKVILHFNVGRLGNIDNIKIIESSGYRILDNAAVKSIQSIKTVKNGSRQHMALQIPVIYQLKGG